MRGRWLWLLLLLPVGCGVILLAALGHHVTETRLELQAVQVRIAALEAERTALLGERDAAQAAARAAMAAAGRLSGPAAGDLAAGAPVAGSALVTAVLAPDRYLARPQPATPEVVLRYPAPQRLRVGQTVAFSGTLAADPGPRGVPQVDVSMPPGPPRPPTG